MKYLKLRRFFVLILTLLPLLSTAGNKIVILGDIEGDGQRFESFIRLSRAFVQTPQGLRIRPGYHFVFMGDTLDRGDSAMQILDTLNDLKKHQADQITTLMGNRDINKLALRTKFSKEIQEGLNHNKDYTLQIESLKRFLDRINAPGAFEFRKAEFLKEARVATDQDVFISMLEDVSPGGRILEYLKSAKIAHVDRESGGIYVHGAISEQSRGRIPGDPTFYENVDEWVHRLNKWAQSLPEELLDYQRPLPETPKRNRKSLVYDRFSEGDGNPEMPAQSVQDYLKRNGLSYLVAGHTPYGDVPVVMTGLDFKIVLVDNSYASHKQASVVEVENGQIHLRGRLKTGEIFKADLPVQGVSKFGHTENGYRILGELQNGDFVSWRVGAEFKSEYKINPRSVKLRCQSVTPGR